MINLADEENVQTQVLREILKWTKFAGMNQVQGVLEITLNTPEKKLAYQLSDGTQASTRIAELSKVGSDFKVRALWKEWRRKGIGDTVSVRGGDRFKRTFDLEDFGIEVPMMPPTEMSKSAPPPSTDQTGGNAIA